MHQITRITPTALSAKAPKTSEIIGNDKESFVNFYTNNRPDKMFVPVADFLAWKGIKVRSGTNQIALSSRVWTLIYREIAAGDYGVESELVIKKSANSSLLFDVDFLINYYEEVRATVVVRVIGG